MPPSRRLIAIIDDDASLRRALERQILMAGYLVAAFASAEEFLLVATACRAACLVCDIGLEGMSGLELAVHQRVTQLELPVVLMTGHCDPQIEEVARGIAVAFLRKPFPNEKLLEAIVDTVGPPIDDGER